MASSYVGRSKLFRARSHNNTKRGGTGNSKAIFYNNYSHNLDPVDSNIKVYIPKEYFKHTGYLKDEEGAPNQSRQQPRKPQTPFKERFNEKLEYPSAAPSQKSGKQMINHQAPRVRHVGGASDETASVLSKVIT
jgi:hypothetical protein